jgi:hypothetical protein
MVERPDYFRSTAVSRDAARVSCSSFMPVADINPAISPPMLCKSIASKSYRPTGGLQVRLLKETARAFSSRETIVSYRKKQPAKAGCSLTALGTKIQYSLLSRILGYAV